MENTPRYRAEPSHRAVLDTQNGTREWFNTPAEAIEAAADRNGNPPEDIE